VVAYGVPDPSAGPTPASKRESGNLKQVATSAAATPDNLFNILTEARRELASAEARLGQLLDRAAALTAVAEQERTQLQRFLEEFALEQTVYDQQPRTGSGGTGPLIDVAALRRGAQELSDELNHASALRGNLATALQVMRACKEQFARDRAFQPVQDTADVRLQQAMNAAREDERRRLAREVHDGPAQVLANAIFAIEIAEQVARRAPDQVAEELSRVRALLKDGVAEVRRFMFDLRPSMLQDQGLAPTLRRYVEDFNRFFGKRVSLDLSEPLPSLTADQELTIFRIVQEALQNIHKHAMIDEASIVLSHAGSLLELNIADSGKGFHPNTVVARPGTGAGLPGMRERAKLIGADLTVESAPGAGTVLRLSMMLRTTTGALGLGQSL
jgi:two-component system sensor histidine kinase DegS